MLTARVFPALERRCTAHGALRGDRGQAWVLCEICHQWREHIVEMVPRVCGRSACSVGGRCTRSKILPVFPALRWPS